MPILISQATEIQAAGNPPKLIREYIGRVNSQTGELSIAGMAQPGRLERTGTDARVRGIYAGAGRRVAAWPVGAEALHASARGKR